MTNRPKGKDFTAMSNRAGVVAAAPPTQQQQPPAPAPAPPPVKKGKDFTAMSNRMGGPPQPAAAAAQNVNVSVSANGPADSHLVDAARKRQLQNAARAAAGYTPNSKPSGGMTPPSMPSSRGPRTSPGQMQQPQQQQQPGNSPVASKQSGKQTIQRRVSKTTSVAANRRGSKSTKTGGTGDGQNTKSPEPSASEGRLSLAAATSGGTTGRNVSKKSSSKAGAGPHVAPLVGPRIADLVKSIDPNYGIEADAEEQVLQLADDFLDKVTKQAIRLSQHRGSKTLDVRDLQIVLAKNFGIVVPGLGVPAIRPFKSASVATKSSASGGSKSSSAKRNASAAMGESGGGPARKKANTGSAATSKASGVPSAST
eukprot:jgi/Psemu1/287240/fgenesh1_pg.181_\